jgi:hypothetical protein
LVVIVVVVVLFNSCIGLRIVFLSSSAIILSKLKGGRGCFLTLAAGSESLTGRGQSACACLASTSESWTPTMPPLQQQRPDADAYAVEALSDPGSGPSLREGDCCVDGTPITAAAIALSGVNNGSGRQHNGGVLRSLRKSKFKKKQPKKKMQPKINEHNESDLRSNKKQVRGWVWRI